MNFIEIIQQIESNDGILFGSRAWHTNGPDSDYDYVMPLTKAKYIKDYLAQAGINIVDNAYYVSGFYIYIEDKIINITGCRTDDFEAWEMASNMMKLLEICDKSNRQLLFETILSILKKISFTKHIKRDISLPF